MKNNSKNTNKGFYSLFLPSKNQFGENWTLTDIDNFLEEFMESNDGELPNVIRMKFKDYCYFTSLFNPHPDILGKTYFTYRGIIIKFI